MFNMCAFQAHLAASLSLVCCWLVSWFCWCPWVWLSAYTVSCPLLGSHGDPFLLLEVSLRVLPSLGEQGRCEPDRILPPEEWFLAWGYTAGVGDCSVSRVRQNWVWTHHATPWLRDLGCVPWPLWALAVPPKDNIIYLPGLLFAKSCPKCPARICAQ